MCKAYYQEQPYCGCVRLTGNVELCPLFTSLPVNKGKTSFSPKLLTQHCQGLDLFFNGVNYVSFDVENDDIAPTGLDCRYLELDEQWEDFGECVLCDTKGVLKFLKAKGVEHTPVVKEEALDLRDEAAEGGAEDVRVMAVERSGGRCVSRFANRVVGGSVEKGGVVDKANCMREMVMVEKGGKRLGGKRKRSHLVEPSASSASMGWD